MSPFDHSTQIQHLLDQLRAGHAAARDALIRRAFDRLRLLAQRMFHRRHADLRVAFETDDVLQNAAVRLHRALPEVLPDTVRRFFALAGTQIRRELIDLARRHFGADGARPARMIYLGGSSSRSHHRILEEEEAGHEGEPSTLEEWSVFHEQTAALPDEEHEVVDLLWYQGLSQNEAATMLGVSNRTVKRRWRSARLLLHRALHGEWPGL